MPGIFISIEGTDGSGKGTQTELLVNRLRAEGKEVEVVSFPQYGESSAAVVEDYLHGKFGTAQEVGPYRGSVFYAIDRYAASKKIRAWLAENKIVIANRYVGSNMAHQGGKISNSSEQEKYFAWVYNLEYTIFAIPKPDFSLILHVPAEVAQNLVDQKEAREYLHGKKRDIHEDDIAHLKAAETTYLKIAQTFPEYTVIECAPGGELQSVEQVHQSIWTLVNSHLA
ncbi:MAG: thymidylate kinase [Candidatus Magasanikbacteria bacterium]|nr:thymidylate kinase [Candidatus Magasanikbacteria bacterium]